MLNLSKIKANNIRTAHTMCDLPRGSKTKRYDSKYLVKITECTVLAISIRWFFSALYGFIYDDNADLDVINSRKDNNNNYYKQNKSRRRAE